MGIQIFLNGTFEIGRRNIELEDSRVSFIKRCFQDMLPSFFKQCSSQKQLIINLDANL